MELLPTLNFRWNAPAQSGAKGGRLVFQGLGQGQIIQQSSYTDPISTSGADQIGLFVVTKSGSTTNVNAYVRLAWSGTLEDGSAPAAFVEECVETVGAVVNGAQRYSLSAKEYGPLTTVPATKVTIWIPTGAHYFKIGVYGDSSPIDGTSVLVYVERARIGAPGQQGR